MVCPQGGPVVAEQGERRSLSAAPAISTVPSGRLLLPRLARIDVTVVGVGVHGVPKGLADNNNNN